MNKQYKVNKLKIRPNDVLGRPGVITHVFFTASISDGENTASAEQWCTLPHLDDSNFVSLENLTEEMLISWIIANIKMEQLDFILERLLLKEKYGTPIEIDPPWLS